MALQYLDLGKASFVSTKANVMVEIRASAGLYCDSGKHLGERSSELCGEWAICEDIWICKSHDFRLSFIASSNHDAIDSTGIEEEHLEEIENVLQAAQLWKQLALQPTLLQQNSSTGCPFKPSNRHFVLALRDDHARQIHNAGNGPKVAVPPPDVANLRATDRVQTIQLVSVLISLRFHKVSARKARESSENTTSDPLASTTALLTGEEDTQGDNSAFEESSENFESLLESDDFGAWNAPADMNYPSNDAATIPKSKRQVVARAIILLTDIALRSLICPEPKRLPSGIAPCKESNVFHLAKLAPSVFIPGYRDAVESRVKFIPGIAKFLSRFLQQSAQQTRPKGRPSGSNANLSELPTEQTYTTDRNEGIKRDLWMTLANGVKNVESARKLQPLHIARTGGSHESNFRTFEDLLDTWHPREGHNTTHALEYDFENLYLNEEEDFVDSDTYFSDLYDEVLFRPTNGVDNVVNSMMEQIDDEVSEVLSSPPSLEKVLGVTSNLARSPSESEHTAAAVARSGSCSSRATNKGLQAELDSSASQLNEATQICISSSLLPDVIGANGCSHAYVSRMHPTYTLEDNDSSRAEHLLFEQFNRHAFDTDFLISPVYDRSTTIGAQDLISIDEDQDCTLLDKFDYDIEMPSYEKSNRSSLTDIIGGDQLLWQMWTKRRPSMIQTDDDMLEMHAMYARDPDMRIFEAHKAVRDENGDDYMRDSNTSKRSSINSASSSLDEQQDFMLPYGQLERKHHGPFQLHKDSSPTPSQNNMKKPTGRGKLNRGQSFLKRWSGGRASMEEAPDYSRRFSRDEPRDVEIKRRKTLADYDKPSDDNDMLLG